MSSAFLPSRRSLLATAGTGFGLLALAEGALRFRGARPPAQAAA